MRQFLKIAFLFCLVLPLSCKSDSSIADDTDDAKSVVIRGKVQVAGSGVGGVVVTDGVNFTQSADDGSYALSSNTAARFVYISSPSGYTVPVDNSVPVFYNRIASSTNLGQVNFSLVKMDISDRRHFFVAIGDPQVRNDAELTKYKRILDFLKTDIGSSNLSPVHMMVAGDIVFDTPVMHNPLKLAHASIPQPFYYTIGNHDHIKRENQPASDSYDETASDVYVNNYGPRYYSFNRGLVHYVVLDDIFYRGGPDTDYSVDITSEQLSWLKKDLSFVSTDKAVVVMLHAPTKSRTKSFYGNCNKLHELISGYKNVQIISGHTHYNSVVADATGITEHIVGAACGGWWEGPVCTDGAFLGYKIFEVDGTSVKWKYRAYEFPGKQFSVFKPGPRLAGLRPSEELLVNVWDWDPSWTVQVSEDNGASFKNMIRYSDKTYDPTAFQLFGKDGDTSIPIGRGWIDASTTDHIFSFVPSKDARKLVVKVVTRFNEEFREEVEL